MRTKPIYVRIEIDALKRLDAAAKVCGVSRSAMAAALLNPAKKSPLAKAMKGRK
jgi:hypothetical protein